MRDILSQEKQRRIQCGVIKQAILDYCGDLSAVRYQDDVSPHTYSRAEAWRWLNTTGKDIMLNKLNIPITLTEKVLRNPLKLLEWANQINV